MESIQVASFKKLVKEVIGLNGSILPNKIRISAFPAYVSTQSNSINPFSVNWGNATSSPGPTPTTTSSYYATTYTVSSGIAHGFYYNNNIVKTPIITSSDRRNDVVHDKPLNETICRDDYKYNLSLTLSLLLGLVK